MGRRSRSWLAVVATLSVAVIAAAQEPMPAAREEARSRFMRGVELYKKGELAPALAEFRLARSLVRRFEVLFNIGQVCVEMSDHACAFDAFTTYLAEGGAKVPAARRAEVARELSRLSGRVATLDVTSTPSGAEIRVDDEPRIHPSPATIVVSAGQRRLAATKEGFSAATTLLDVAGGERRAVAITLDPIPAPPPPPAEPPPPPPPPTSAVVEEPPPPPPAPPPEVAPPPASRPLWIGWTTAGAFTAAATLTGVLSLSARSSLERDKSARGISFDELDAANKRRAHLALATDILGGAALVATGVTLYFALSPDSPPASVGISPAGLSFRARF